MTFTFEVPDDLIPSVETYLAAQVRTENNRVSGATEVIRLAGHESPAAFFNHQLTSVLHQIAEKHPTGAMLEKLLKAKALQEEVKASAASRVIPAEK